MTAPVRRFVQFCIVATVSALLTTTVVLFVLDEISQWTAFAAVFVIATSFVTAIGAAAFKESRTKRRQRRAEMARRVEDGRRLRLVAHEPTEVLPCVRAVGRAKAVRNGLFTAGDHTIDIVLRRMMREEEAG